MLNVECFMLVPHKNLSACEIHITTKFLFIILCFFIGKSKERTWQTTKYQRKM